MEHDELLKELLAELKAVRAELGEIKTAVEKSASITESKLESEHFI